jgi:hypothetical protein
VRKMARTTENGNLVGIPSTAVFSTPGIDLGCRECNVNWRRVCQVRIAALRARAGRPEGNPVIETKQDNPLRLRVINSLQSRGLLAVELYLLLNQSAQMQRSASSRTGIVWFNSFIRIYITANYLFDGAYTNICFGTEAGTISRAGTPRFGTHFFHAGLPLFSPCSPAFRGHLPAI